MPKFQKCRIHQLHIGELYQVVRLTSYRSRDFTRTGSIYARRVGADDWDILFKMLSFWVVWPYGGNRNRSPQPLIGETVETYGGVPAPLRLEKHDADHKGNR